MSINISKSLKALLFLFTVFVCLMPIKTNADASLAERKEDHSPGAIIRVQVEEKQKLIRVRIDGPFIAKILPSLQEIRRGNKLDSTPITGTSRGIKLGSQEWAGQGVRVEPINDRDLYLDGSRYRGYVEIIKDGEGSLIAVNSVDLENYLYGVLPHEVAHWWPMEALKAQAIAARTYALYQSKTSKAQPFDVRSSTFSQVYGGSTVERFRANRAVDLTKGKILTYQNKIFPTYFNASCGGKTAGAKELWKIDLPPLSGGVVCRFCWFSPHYDWSSRIPLAEIEGIMKKNGRPLGQILRIEPVSQTPSGRVGSIKITGNLGEATLAAKDFRVWIGGNRIRSTLFTVTTSDDFAQFRGRGWGHGVGLCQWGALGQALLGHTYQEILRFYYPGSDIQEAA